MSKSDSGREPFECLEFVQDFCPLTSGQGACAATLANTGDSKCYNTIGTCRSLASYQQGERVLRFCTAQQRLPDDGEIYFPFLISVSVKPCTINPGGGNRNSSGLGTRATISASFSDHPHSGNYVDKYAGERLTGAAQIPSAGYDPFQISTFWAKWRARNQYYLNRVMRLKSGYITTDGQVVDVVTRTFICTGFSGPDSSGRVSMSGSDILTRVQNDKAQAPGASEGKLDADISDTDTAITLLPIGVGATYPASGLARIGDELVTFTRSGDNVTISRAKHNTLADTHSEGDTFQICLVVDALTPAEILELLLTDYAGIPAANLDLAQWASETIAYLPRKYYTIITSPVGVADLVAEICEQMYFYTWFDERADKVKIRAVRPADGEEVYRIGDDNLVEDSVSIADQPDQLITHVIINYAPRDYTKALDDVTNYAVTDVFGSGEDAPERNDGMKIKTIQSRWLQADDGAAAIALGEKLLARYKTPPRAVSFALDAKDRDIWVGDFVNVTTRHNTNEHGQREPISAQVFSASESTRGTTFSYQAQQFVYELPPDPTDKAIDIAADVWDYNLYDRFVAIFGAPLATDVIRVTIRVGAVVGSTSVTTPAFHVDNRFPAGVTINVINNGVIAGKGGNGGIDVGLPSQVLPETGGDAFKTEMPISIENNSVIGGGGGGAAGASISGFDAGGGGAGSEPGNGGSWTAAGTTMTAAAGSLFFGGKGSSSYPSDMINGGDLGKGTTNIFIARAAGRAIVGIANITYINRGDIRGAEV